MKLLLFDLETTGLSPEFDRITELGYLIRDTEVKRPILMRSDLLFEDSYPQISEKITKITGITHPMLKEFGDHPIEVLMRLEDRLQKLNVEYLVAHNGKGFDLPFLKAEIKRQGIECPKLSSLPLIDTRYDLPWETEPPSRKLHHLSADIGFLNPLPHAALFDVVTMDQILCKFPIDEIIGGSTQNEITIRALVSRENKDLAKFNGYLWNGEKQMWLRKIKENKLEKERAKAQEIGFSIAVITGA